MDERRTPAHRLRDGRSFEPLPDAVVFRRHFASMSGAGPIVGPIVAALAFGWGPVLFWILLGGILLGAVHDYTTLLASVRHQGQGLVQIARHAMGPLSCRLFGLLILLGLLCLIAVFLDLAASTFAPVTEPWGVPPSDAGRLGGSAAAASLGIMAMAAPFGWIVRHRALPMRNAVLLAVMLVFGIWALALRMPLGPSIVPAVFGADASFWVLVLLGACGMASLLPVQAFLQPRDGLVSVLLFGCLAGGASGLLLGAVTGSAPVTWPFVMSWNAPEFGGLFPALFVLVSCGAVSGFHGVLAPGTSARHLDLESSVKRVGLGTMGLQGGLALLALATVMTSSRHPGMAPPAVFAAGMERLFSPLGLQDGAAASFFLLAVCTFLLATLESCIRLCRSMLQELLDIRSDRIGIRILLTALILVLPAVWVLWQIPGPDGRIVPAWRAIWPALGAASHWLAALALLVVYGWLRSRGKRARFVLFPMVFLLGTSLAALGQIMIRHARPGGHPLLAGLALLLAGLAIVVTVDTARHLPRHPLYAALRL